MSLRRFGLLAVVSVLLVEGCAEQSVRFTQEPPKVPNPPILLLNTVADAKRVVTSPVKDRGILWPGTGKLGGDRMALLPISGPGTSGDLLTAVATLELKGAGVKLVERQVMAALRDEFRMYDDFDPGSASSRDKLKELGTLLKAKYFLVAAVTSLDTQLVSVVLPQRKLDPQDRPRYDQEYRRWREQALAYLDALDKSAQVFGNDPEFEKSDQRDAWLFRNSIAKVRRDVVATNFVGIQKLELPQWRPLMVWPDFFNRKERKKANEQLPEPKKEDWKEKYRKLSPYGPYNGFGYRPLLVHLAEELPRSPERIMFELQQGTKSGFQVRQANVSIAFRLIDADTSDYIGMGVFEVDDTSEASALSRLAKKLSHVLVEKLGR